MTLNEFIQTLQELQSAGNGDCEVIYLVDYYGGSGSMVYETDPPVKLTVVVGGRGDPVADHLAGKTAVMIC